MPQATRRWISEKVKSLNESNVLPFHDILDAKMVNAAWPRQASRSRSESIRRLSPSACSSPRYWTLITRAVRRSRG